MPSNGLIAGLVLFFVGLIGTGGAVYSLWDALSSWKGGVLAFFSIVYIIGIILLTYYKK